MKDQAGGSSNRIVDHNGFDGYLSLGTIIGGNSVAALLKPVLQAGPVIFIKAQLTLEIGAECLLGNIIVRRPQTPCSNY